MHQYFLTIEMILNEKNMKMKIKKYYSEQMVSNQKKNNFIGLFRVEKYPVQKFLKKKIEKNPIKMKNLLKKFHKNICQIKKAFITRISNLGRNFKNRKIIFFSWKREFNKANLKMIHSPKNLMFSQRNIMR